MRSLKITDKEKTAFVDIEVPTVKPNEVLVQIKKVGFCGSDLNTFRGANPLVKYPVIPGHEVSGIIEETGADVPANFKVGMPVAITPQTACGKCSSCKNNRPNACKYNETLGVQRDGALTEYLSVPHEKLIADDSLSLTQLALLEPLAVGFHAARRGKVEEIDIVVVLGCGVIGLGAIAGAAFFGAKVIAVDLFDDKLEKAKQAGASHVINSTSTNVIDTIHEITDGHEADVVIEAAGNPNTYKLAIEAVAFTGRVVYIGYTAVPVEFTTKFFVLKELDIRGSRGSERLDFLNVLKAVQNGQIDPAELVSHTFPFDQADKAIRMWSNDPSKVTKIVVEM